MTPDIHRIAVNTGGGDAPGLNAVIRAVVRSAEQHGWEVLGIKDGYNGLFEENGIVRLDRSAVRGITHLGGTIIGTTNRGDPLRWSVDNEDGSATFIDRSQEVIDTLATHEIDALIAIGGDGSLSIAQALFEKGLNVVGVPKTIDNDLAATNLTFGFLTAVETATDALDKLHSTAEAHERVMVVELMGRHAGWIAAAGGMAADGDNDIPILILFPEVPFERHRFMAAVKQKVKTYGYCSVVVSEGLRDHQGRFLSDQGLRDAFGHAQLGGVASVISTMVKDDLGLKYHYAVADYLQRSARHIASLTDVSQAYAVGQAAVELALRGKNSIMPSIVRTSNKPYRWRIGEAKLSRVANREKMMPASFITRDGFGITQRCRTYLEPLMKGEDYPPYRNGLPRYVRLKNTAVPKKLKTPFTL